MNWIQFLDLPQSRFALLQILFVVDIICCSTREFALFWILYVSWISVSVKHFLLLDIEKITG